MSSPSDAEVVGRSLAEPEAFGLIYDRHAATLLRFLGRRAGARVAEGLVGELFRIAFEVARDTPFYDPTITEAMVAHISRFAREIGALEGQVRYDEVVATQFAALWKG